VTFQSKEPRKKLRSPSSFLVTGLRLGGFEAHPTMPRFLIYFFFWGPQFIWTQSTRRPWLLCLSKWGRYKSRQKWQPPPSI